jgi:hypothetical protein
MDDIAVVVAFMDEKEKCPPPRAGGRGRGRNGGAGGDFLLGFSFKKK